MKYNQIIKLEDGRECLLRNAAETDGQALLDLFRLAHSETDFLRSYPDEKVYDAVRESAVLKEKSESENEIEMLAEVDGRIVGSAGISAVGSKYKVRHRAEFGISVVKDFWGLGIGRALTAACIECARKAGYVQLELNVVAENERAAEMYKKFGFVEFGRNPKAFNSRVSGFQEVIYMRLEL